MESRERGRERERERENTVIDIVEKLLLLVVNGIIVSYTGGRGLSIPEPECSFVLANLGVDYVNNSLYLHVISQCMC